MAKKIICPKCRAEYDSDDTIFCSKCGSKLLKCKEENINIDTNIKVYVLQKIALILSFLLFIIGSFCFVDYINKFSRYNLQEIVWGDTEFSIKASYDASSKTIYVNLLSDLLVESWQEEMINNSGFNAEITLTLNQKETLRTNYISYTSGEFLQANFVIAQATLSDYVRIKKLFKESVTGGGLSISYPEALSPDSEERMKIKQKYYKSKQQAKEADRYLDSLLFLSIFGLGS